MTEREITEEMLGRLIANFEEAGRALGRFHPYHLDWRGVAIPCTPECMREHMKPKPATYRSFGEMKKELFGEDHED